MDSYNDLSTNFFEWGVRCKELGTKSDQIADVSPIMSISFAWNTVQPDFNSSLTANTSKRTYGVGQCKFDMMSSEIRCKLQDVFKSQAMVATLEIIRFINLNGQAAEVERYLFRQVYISNYQVSADPVANICRDSISITSTGAHEYIQTMYKDGMPQGQRISCDSNKA